MVKSGDVVKAGQLLISGIIPAELGGGFVRAEGAVVGRVKDEFSVTVAREEIERTYSQEKLLSLSLEIFGFSLNIFKSYSISDKECVIIEDTENLTVFGSVKLPVKIKKVYQREYCEKERAYNDSELVKIAMYRLNQLRIIGIADAELLKATTSGDFTDNGYNASVEVLILKKIGEERIISY
jgi:hypothetical protein